MASTLAVPRNGWKAAALSARRTLARYREKGAVAGEQILGTAASAAGGLGAGLLNSKFPTLRGQNFVTASTLTSAVLIGVGAAGLAGKASDAFLDAGRGALAADLGIKAFLAAEKRK
jgi:hypothetical protein